MLVKTSELIGPALDWAVAYATGADHLEIVPWGDGKTVSCMYSRPDGGCWANHYTPSTDWSHGGLLLDTNHWALPYRATHRHHLGAFEACTPGGLPHNGPTPLVAACRAIVAAGLSDQVDVPDELMQS